MIETLRLLKYDPAVAVLIMANNHLNIRLLPEFATVSAPVAIAGDPRLTEVVIQTRPTVDEGIRRDYTGQITYRYQRLDVNEVFTDLQLDLTPPITIRGLLNNISAASGLVITDDDFDNGLIESNSFQLTAKGSSLRWVGQTTVTLNEPVAESKLATAFSNNVLNGLIPPEFAATILLSTVLPITELVGLTYDGPKR